MGFFLRFFPICIGEKKLNLKIVTFKHSNKHHERKE